MVKCLSCCQLLTVIQRRDSLFHWFLQAQKCHQMWALFYIINLLVVHTFLLSVMLCLDPVDGEVFIQLVKKVIYSRQNVIITANLAPSQVSLRAGEHMLVRWWGANQESRESDQSVQNHTHPQQPLKAKTCSPVHCPYETRQLLSVFLDKQSVHPMPFASPKTFIVPISLCRKFSTLLQNKLIPLGIWFIVNRLPSITM